VEIVSFCSDGDVRASHPNITEYSEYFIPEWWAAFFWNCTNLTHIDQSCVLLSWWLYCEILGLCFGGVVVPWRSWWWIPNIAQ
jgi:hypothetical protein